MKLLVKYCVFIKRPTPQLFQAVTFLQKEGLECFTVKTLESNQLLRLYKTKLVTKNYKNNLTTLLCLNTDTFCTLP